MAEALRGAGYLVDRHPGPGADTGDLLVTRPSREPDADEWAALERLALLPLPYTRDHGVDGVDGVPNELLSVFSHAGLITFLRYPQVRRSPQSIGDGELVSLTRTATNMIEARNHQREMRVIERLTRGAVRITQHTSGDI